MQPARIVFFLFGGIAAIFGIDSARQIVWKTLAQDSEDERASPCGAALATLAKGTKTDDFASALAAARERCAARSEVLSHLEEFKRAGDSFQQAAAILAKDAIEP